MSKQLIRILEEIMKIGMLAVAVIGLSLIGDAALEGSALNERSRGGRP